MGLERGPLSLVSTTEELLGRKSSGFCLEIRDYGRRNQSLWPRCTLYPQTLALSSLTSGSRSVGIVRSRTKATEFSFVLPYKKLKTETEWLIHSNISALGLSVHRLCAAPTVSCILMLQLQGRKNFLYHLFLKWASDSITHRYLLQTRQTRMQAILRRINYIKFLQAFFILFCS
jgi:hypothetical protein